MDRVRKTLFNPLATDKASIRKALEDLPVGSAHPFSPGRTLLCRTEAGVNEIDISSYPDDFFFNAVDLGEMGEILLRRMAGFKTQLGVFDDFQITQPSASTFSIPIVSGAITILAVSERKPTYYDFCLADDSTNACCWCAQTTFRGINHSGDINHGNDLLHYATLDARTLVQKDICVFISGYQCTKIHKFKETHPALMVADHVDKILYIVPVPLDRATIGDATICCPLVIRRQGDSLICSILPTAATAADTVCQGAKLVSSCFPEAIRRADFTLSGPQIEVTPTPEIAVDAQDVSLNLDLLQVSAKKYAVIATDSIVNLPSSIDLARTQIITFGTGLEFKLEAEGISQKNQTSSSSVVLPCVFGSQLEGPLLLATGTVPKNVPFLNERALREYYEQLDTITVIVDDRMTDNARNLASSLRLNALFIVQLHPDCKPASTDAVLSLLDSTNVNAVTALAGPQSLVLVQISDKYYFYRGIANLGFLNTTKLAFGTDVTSVVESVGFEGLLIDPRAKRIVDLNEPNAIILTTSGQLVKPQDLESLFKTMGVDQLQEMEEDVAAAVPQLQVLLNQKDLSDLSKTLIKVLSGKVAEVSGPLRDAYVAFLTQEYKSTDPELVKKKNRMLGELRKTALNMQKALEPVISSLANLVSAQTTSKRTHDLKRLVRQAQIQGNVEAAKSMTFETLSGYLETHAIDMGVMLLNIEETPYRQLLGRLKGLDVATIDASACCDLDSRVLHLEGFDAGIIIEQSQSQHHGPLRSQNGPTHPTLAVPYLNHARGENGSMIAWVCWDEFVSLESPYSVRWMEKCNEPHIAAMRIITRDTLSQAVISREFNLEPGSPEISHLMAALLFTAMSKLAAMRTSTPVVLDRAEDTVTRLMRGLFGNLLTIAGSGVRPLSMVWQLFGFNPSYDIPTTPAEWVWYENVVRLYPYTGWPLKAFHINLEKLLDKMMVRIITKSESLSDVKSSRTEALIRFCRLRNIQLDHSRTIITIMRKLLTMPDADVSAIAARLLAHIPHTLERQSRSYPRMIHYLEHLAAGHPRRVVDDVVAASVYTKRSAAFAQLKTAVSQAIEVRDWARVKETCRALVDRHAKIAQLWGIADPNKLNLQNIKPYRELLEGELGDQEQVGEDRFAKNLELTRQVLSDAEKGRVPWQVGKEGQYGGGMIEPLDEGLVQEVLTGARADVDTEEAAVAALDELEAKMETTSSMALVEQKKTIEQQFLEHRSALQASFVSAMQKDLSAADVCSMLKIPKSVMRVFVQALNPDFVYEDLGWNFKVVMLGLVKDRSNRLESRPVKKLLELRGVKVEKRQEQLIRG